MDVESFVKQKVKWLGHASFRIEGTKSTVYIDPWKLEAAVPADLVLITHSHFDHLSPQDVEKISKPSTVIVGPEDCKSKFGAAFKVIAPGGELTVGDVTVEAAPAYNIDKDFHPNKNGWVGYVVTIDGMRIYHAGDTDVVREMTDIRADVALLPVGGTYTMNVRQAAEAVEKIKPKVAVPMHCGDIVGTLGDRQTFESLSKASVVILEITQ